MKPKESRPRPDADGPNGARGSEKPPPVLTRGQTWLCHELAAALSDHADAQAAYDNAVEALERQGAGDVAEAKERARRADAVTSTRIVTANRDALVAAVAFRLIVQTLADLKDCPEDTAAGSMTRLKAFAAAATTVLARLEEPLAEDCDEWIVATLTEHPSIANLAEHGIDAKELIAAATRAGRAAPERATGTADRNTIIATADRLGDAAQRVVRAFTEADVWSDREAGLRLSARAGRARKPGSCYR